jgi:predicted MFS family arabinose efflux permease
MSSLGYFIGPLLGGVISQMVSLEAPFYVCALLASLNLVLRLFIDPPKAERLQRAEPSTRACPEETLISIHSPTLTEPRSPPSLGSYPPSPNLFAQLSSVHLCARTSISQPLPPIREETDFTLIYLFSLQEIAVCGTVISLTAGSFAVVETLIANHLDRLFGFTPMGVAFMMMAYVLPCAIFSHLGGKWADRFDRYLVMCLTMACFSLTHVLLGYSTSVLTLVIASTLYSATWAAASAQAIPEMATVINRLGGDSYARVYAVSNIYYALGMLVGPIMAEYCDKLVGFATTMVILAVLVVAALPLLAFAARKSIRKELHTQILDRLQTPPQRRVDCAPIS